MFKCWVKHPVSPAFGLVKCYVFTADPQDLICKDPLFSILCLLFTVYQPKSAPFPPADCIEGIECVDNNIEGCITADSGEYCPQYSTISLLSTMPH